MALRGIKVQMKCRCCNAWRFHTYYHPVYSELVGGFICKRGESFFKANPQIVQEYKDKKKKKRLYLIMRAKEQEQHV